VTRYEGFNENDIMTATFTLTDTVSNFESQGRFFIATIRSEHSAEALVAVRGTYPVAESLRPAHGETYWLVAEGNRVIRLDRLNLSDLPAGGAIVELAFPVQLGSGWSMYDNPPNPLPNRQVTQQGSLTAPAGTFKDCFYLQGQMGGTTLDDWFCPGIGFVWDNAEHHGTPIGSRRELVRFTVRP
jgi:hypothetical protein